MENSTALEEMAKLEKIFQLHFDEGCLGVKWSHSFTEQFHKLLLKTQITFIERVRKECAGGKLVHFSLQECDFPIHLTQNYPYNITKVQNSAVVKLDVDKTTIGLLASQSASGSAVRFAPYELRSKKVKKSESNCNVMAERINNDSGYDSK